MTYKMFSIKAYYHSDLALRANPNREEMNRQNKKAAQLYVRAAECYPTDDEEHSSTSDPFPLGVELAFMLYYLEYLGCALQHFRIANALTLRKALDLMERARLSHDVSCKIWNVHPSRRRPKEEQSHQNLVDCEKSLREQLRVLPPGSVDLDGLVVNIGR